MAYVSVPPGAPLQSTAASNQVSLTISGLNGNIDGDYGLDGYIIPPSDAGNAAIYTVQINGAATSQKGVSSLTFDGGPATIVGTADLRVITTQVNPGVNLSFTATLMSKSGNYRVWSCQAFRDAATDVAYDSIGEWTDTTTVISSLSLVSTYNGGAAGLLTGSFFRVYRLRHGP